MTDLRLAKPVRPSIGVVVREPPGIFTERSNASSRAARRVLAVPSPIYLLAKAAMYQFESGTPKTPVRPLPRQTNSIAGSALLPRIQGLVAGRVTVTVEDVADHGTGFVHRRFTTLQHGNLADGAECTTEGLIEKLESSLPSPRPIH